MNLKAVVERTDSTAGRIFDLTTQLLIVASLVSFSLETLPDLSLETRMVLWYVEAGFIAAFTVEYLLRVWVATRKLGFVLSFFGLVDLTAIVPFYAQLALGHFGLGLGTASALRYVRVLRLLRVFRAFKLLRYNTAIRRFRRALIIAKEELLLFLFVSLLLLYLSAVGVYYFENGATGQNNFTSVFDSLWWAVCTLTTVGYGDVFPVTTGGKVFTFVVLMIGLGIVAVPTGIFATALSEARKSEQ